MFFVYILIPKKIVTMKIIVLLIFSSFLIGKTTFSQQEIIPFDSDRWDKQNAKETEFLGRNCLMGIASLKDVEFENGVIEFDLAVNGERSYPGVTFRAQSGNDYERIYVRPHLSKTFQNVVQYEGTFNGLDSWQLYYGEGMTASAEIPLNQWVHLKIEVNGNQARLFLNDAVNPLLTITDLAHGQSKGTLGVWGPMDGSAYYSNFSYRSENNLKFPEAPKPEHLTGIITDWQLSQPYKLSSVDMENLPEKQGIQDITWQKIQSLPSGLVDVSRYFGRLGQTPDIVWAKTEIISDKELTKQFAFGYSDYIGIFLNGQLFFMGNSTYMSRDGNFQGIIGYNDYICLPLIKGKNELVVAVAESFGGWGFQFRDVDAIFEHPDLTKQWEIRNKFKYPESVVYDKKRDVLYVSNFTYERDGFISRVKMDGSIEKLDWIIGILQPSGMQIVKDKLYVVGRYALIEIDIENGIIINRYPFPQAVFANDVTSDEIGNFYVSDGGKAAIYKLEDGKFIEWLISAELTQVNGILADKNNIWVGTSGDGSLKAIDLKTKQITTLFTFGKPTIMDGLKKDVEGNLLISDNAGRLFRISPDGKSELLLNSKSRQINLADFEYIPENKAIVIPTLDDNRLMMYKLNE